VEEHIIDTDGAAFNSRMMYKVGIQDMGRVGTEGGAISYEGLRLHQGPRNSEVICIMKSRKSAVVLLSLKGCVAELGCQGGKVYVLFKAENSAS
jgi:hypothetical protein